MAVGIRIKLPGITQEQFDTVHDEINPSRDVPAGLIFHSSGPIDGGWGIIDFWESRADFDAYKMKIDTLVARFEAEVKAGTPEDQILAKIKTDDLGWNVNIAQWQAPARLDPLYAELKAAAK